MSVLVFVWIFCFASSFFKAEEMGANQMRMQYSWFLSNSRNKMSKIRGALIYHNFLIITVSSRRAASFYIISTAADMLLNVSTSLWHKKKKYKWYDMSWNAPQLAHGPWNVKLLIRESFQERLGSFCPFISLVQSCLPPIFRFSSGRNVEDSYVKVRHHHFEWWWVQDLGHFSLRHTPDKLTHFH